MALLMSNKQVVILTMILCYLEQYYDNEKCFLFNDCVACAMHTA